MAVAGAAVAAASVAATAASSIQKAKAAKKAGAAGATGTTSVQLPMWAKMFNRGTADLLDEQRRVMEDATAAGAFVQPEMWKALGYEPVYDERQNADISALGAQADAADKAVRDATDTVAANKEQIIELRAEIKKTKGKGRKKKIKALRAEIRTLSKEKKTANKESGALSKQAQAAAAALGDAQTVPRRIIGLRKLEKAPDPTDSKDGLFRMTLDLQNETLVRALRGEEPIDSTLRTAFDEKERTMREKLRRQFGEDYEFSTPGSEALRNFERERGEAFEQFNRATVRDFSAMTEARAAALSNLTTARLGQLNAPVAARNVQGDFLGRAADARSRWMAAMLGGATKNVKESSAVPTSTSADILSGLGDALGASSGTVTSMGGGGNSTAPGVDGNSSVGPYAGTYQTDNTGFGLKTYA